MTFELLVKTLVEKQITLDLKEGNLSYRAPKDVMTDEVRALINKYRTEILAKLRKEQNGKAENKKAMSIQVIERTANGLPLSSFQERLWILNQKDPTDVSYNIPIIYGLQGEVNVEALEKSLTTLIARHESLRTRFVINEAGKPVQVIDAAASYELPVMEVCAEQADQYIRANYQHRFNLSTGPVLVAKLLRLSPHYHLLVANVHHIVSDAWSMQRVFLTELQRCYWAYCAGQEPQLPQLKVQYADFAYWQQAQDLTEPLGYWQRSLAGYEDSLALPTDYMRHAGSGQRSEQLRYRYSSEFAQRLERFSHRHGCTLFMSLLAGLYLVVSRYTDRQDICLGTTTAGRSMPELEELIGFFVNILPLRLVINEQLSVAQYVERVREVALQGFDHQLVPFERILNALAIQRENKANPLVPIIVRHQNFPRASMEGITGGLQFSRAFAEANESDTLQETIPFVVAARCEVEISYLGDGSELEVEVVYASDLYRRETIERLLAHHERLLEGMFADEGRVIKTLPMLSDAEVQRQCEAYNSVDQGVVLSKSMVQRFEGQAQQTPMAIACYDARGPHCYQEIEAQSNRLAHALIARGIERGDRVGMCLERGAELLVSILGVWKAGAAYVPLDPEYPEEYVRQMLEDAAPSCVVSNSAYRSKLNLLNERSERCYALDEQASSLLSQSSKSPGVKISGEDIAYLAYTSGSTGIPKGVLVPQRQLMNWLGNIEKRWPFAKEEVIAQKTSISFVVSVKELFAGLVNGCALVFIDGETVKDPARFVEQLRRYQVSRVNLVPSHLRSVLTYLQAHALSLPDLKFCITAGEALSGEVVMAFRQHLPTARLLNNYGCTELNDVTYYDTAEYQGEHGFVPIGRPIQNNQLYILDRQGRLVPEGVAGELHVSGTSVSVGYHHRAELTSERYVDNPFDGSGQSRLYNTGDVVRYLPDGNLEYLGRWDLQVKVRGYRVDVRQIEHVLGSYAGIERCAVVGQGERLVAYYVAPNLELREVELVRQRLSEQLPAYLVPDSYVKVEALPLLPNGKLDRRGLMALELSHPPDDAYVALETETEQQLAEIWSEVLEVPLTLLGRQSNFFTLGGHSLIAVKVVSLLNTRLGVSLSLSELFESPVLQAFSELIERQLNDPLTGFASYIPPANLIPTDCAAITPEMLTLVDLGAEEIEQIAGQVPGGMRNIQDIYPLAPLQAGILFHHMMDPLNDPYVMSWLFKAGSNRVVTEYIAGLQGVIDRHDAFRTAIVWQGLPVSVQVVLRQATLQVQWITLDAHQDARVQIEALRVPSLQQMDMTQAPLVRLQVAQIGSTEQYFVLLLIHHLISDNSAGGIIEQELVAYRSGKRASLAAPVPYRNFVARTQYLAQHYDAPAFFSQMLGDIEEPTIPFGLRDVQGDGRQIVEAHERLPEAVARQVRDLAKRLQVSPAIVFHTAWAMVVAACSGRDDVVFGTVLSGRLEGGSGSENMLGVFINTLPLRVTLGGQGVVAVVQQVQQALLSLLPYEQTALTVAQGCSGVAKGSPLFSALLNYRHSPGKGSSETNTEGKTKLEHEHAFTYINTRERTNYPLTLTVDDLGVDFGIEVQVDESVEALRVITYVQTALTELVNALNHSPQALMTTVSILPPSEQHQLREWNHTDAEYPHDKCIHELFEAQVKHTPDAVAVIFENQALTYQQLNEKSNQLAHYLKAEKQVTPDTLIGICLERSLEMVIAILGVLKAGGAYVPLDPEYPEARLKYLLDDAKLSTVLTQRYLRNTTPLSDAQAVCLDDEIVQKQLAKQSTKNINPKHHSLTPQQLAYVIYTSGSTGQPKGVMAPHRSIVNRVSWLEQQFPSVDDEVFCQKTSSGFVDHVAEIFQALAYGKRLVIIRTEDTLQTERFSQLVAQHKITRLTLVPSLLKLLIAQGALASMRSLRLVISSGEALALAEAQNFHRILPTTRLLNLYGSSEVGADVSAYLTESIAAVAALKFISIGRPIQNIQLHVLNAQLQPVPVGIAGELYIGGVGLARGYLGREDLTAEKFIANPFDTHNQTNHSDSSNSSSKSKHSERLYKTGDLARYLPDGNLEYLGRLDHQVKIRGFRIELGEIENTLLKNEWVKEAVVVARESAMGDQQLVAYVVTENRDDTAAAIIERLRDVVKQSLPDYMIPSAFVLLDFLPLTPNGKVDRKALPDRDASYAQEDAYVALETETEQQLAEIWSEVLEVPLTLLGRQSNFFTLGGHSLTAVKVVSKLKTTLVTELTMLELFENKIISELSALIDRKQFEQAVFSNKSRAHVIVEEAF